MLTTLVMVENTCLLSVHSILWFSVCLMKFGQLPLLSPLVKENEELRIKSGDNI